MAYLPDLPGCVATGATPDEIIARMQVAGEMHIQGLHDGLPIPEPSAIAAYTDPSEAAWLEAAHG